MPIRHDFICASDTCEHRVENVICAMSDPDASAPEHCGRRMVIDWMTLPQSVQEFIPFVTRNIHPDGKPLKVRNKGDLLRYAREYGVRHVDDPNLVAQGSEIVRRSPKIGKVFDMGRR